MLANALQSITSESLYSAAAREETAASEASADIGSSKPIAAVPPRSVVNSRRVFSVVMG
jgi:hypothetical protein